MVRSSFTDWNPNAEIFAFGKRLSEDFNLSVLRQAFIHRSYIAQELEKQKEVGIENPTLDVEDNDKLIESGSKLLTSYVRNYVNQSLPSAPEHFKAALQDHLLSDSLLAKISMNLGTSDLILSAATVPTEDGILSSTFKAIIGALAESSGEQRAQQFVHDFVCTHLNQLDYTTLWRSENPLKELEAVCAANQLGSPEPRLIGSCGVNTLLASYNVGIYCNKKMIGSGFGETVDTAVQEASSDALRGLFKLQTHQQIAKF